MSVLSKPVLRFDEFSLDPHRRLLTRDDQEVPLSAHLVDVLHYLVERAGQIVTREALMNNFWPDVNVSDNTLTRAVADIRDALGDDVAAPRYIQTAPRRGYRFAAKTDSESGPDTTERLLDFVRGRAALQTLDTRRLPEAVTAFEHTIAAMPNYAPAHTALASATFFQYESTRSLNIPRREWLDDAMVHARRACTLDHNLAEAWAMLGFVLTAAGDGDEARAVAGKATKLEPRNWGHQFRLSVATWGEERLRACERTLHLLPDFAPIRFAAAMVFVARGAFGLALEEAVAGAAAQSRQVRHDGAAFPAIGLHWLRGLLLLQAGDAAEAMASFERELAELHEHQIYALEFRVNAEVAAGFAHLAAADVVAAAEAFRRALAVHPDNGRALIGLYEAVCHQRRADEAQQLATRIDGAVDALIVGQRLGEAALIKAAAQAVRGDLDGACATLTALLTQAPAGHAGWLIAIDPAFARLRTHPQYPQLLTKLSGRAM